MITIQRLKVRLAHPRHSKRLKVFFIALLLGLGLIYLYFQHGTGSFNRSSADSHLERLARHSKNQILEPVFVFEKLGNFEPKETEERTGPGQNGKPHYVGPEKQNEARNIFMEYGINLIVSDEISLDRAVPDMRNPECKHWDYPEDLPKTSVVIVFHNEGWSTLLRTVHSVLNRSPPQFLEEVLLVDDFSDKRAGRGQPPLLVPLGQGLVPLGANLQNLNEYIKQFNGKVRLVKNVEREGLIRSKARGAKEARGEVVLFLDSHCEVNLNWLPPLLAPILKDRTTMTVPIIDGIDKDTLEYRPVYQGNQRFRGIFEWGMFYKETEIPQREAERHKYISEPYKSPTHAGGLFAIDREFFLKLGAYDPGLLVWGGEQYELSFKIWQCGGSIEWVPCSRVGHIYRGFMPYNFGKLAEKKKGPLITINNKRVIEVWFDDEYKEYFYTREPLARFLDMGDITEQLELKKQLGCKNFKWFMENVAYDLPLKYPELPPNVYWGELRNEAVGLCMDSMGHSPPTLMGISACHGYGNNQLVRLNAKGQLGLGERCIEADRQGIKLAFCRLGTVDGPWLYDSETKSLRHRQQQKCVAVHPQTNQLHLAPCVDVNNYQKWTFKTVVPNW
ncbi:unnamed protein product [Darwinula stevensoni]|uniref:Polypeptide N-acetylgalactosaminyltransferase n=1 Tax=Darwinula stevensoni TaxID=69355 RepID=A0A7R8WYQ5_9CRUS|nr:unnamed protein product [Darwinula stevensoni]CAG0879677.1 unnamed protein product [Darwinula stevensoni]